MENKYILHYADEHRLSADELSFTCKIFFGVLISESRLKIIKMKKLLSRL